MPLVRLLFLCLAVALAAQPSRAAAVCPMAAHQMSAAQVSGDCDHATAPREHRRNCPGQMACCAPMAVRASAPALAAPHVWRLQVPERPSAERDREDAASGSLLRPPRST